MTKSADFKIQGLAFNSGEQAKFTLITPTGRVDIQLRIPGKHNVSNALAAAAATHALKIPLPLIAQGLNRFTGVKGRMTFLAGKHKSVIVDDTYNANLRSTLAALEVLAKFQGRRIFVFGDMGELGEWSRPHHEEVGKVARDYGIDELHTCGTYSQLAANAFGAKAQHYSEQPELIQRVLAQLNANTMVLIKGSRSSAMEKIVQQLVENN